MRSMLSGVVVLAAGCLPALEPAPAPGNLAIIEVAPSGVPHDWFEIENRSDAPIELSDYVFADRRADFVRARRFPETTLAPGARHVQEVVRLEHGFQLGKRETVWIYHHEDRVLIARARAGRSE